MPSAQPARVFVPTAPAPTIAADGTVICPANGHVTQGHYAACDVYLGMDTSCTPGKRVSTRDGLPNAPGCGQVASVSGSAGPTSGGRPGGSTVPAGGATGTTGNTSDTISPQGACVVGKWVPSMLFKNKQDLWLVSYCAADASVEWFLGAGAKHAGSVHAFATAKGTGGSVYPGQNDRLTIYTCSIDHPHAVKPNGDPVDGHGEQWLCKTGNPFKFLE